MPSWPQCRRSWQGLAGKPVNVETLGGYLQYKYGTFFPLVVSLWSILALSGTLAAEARRGSLEFVAANPMTRRRIALEKLLGHVTSVVIAMAVIFVSIVIAGGAFAKLPGDAFGVDAAAGYAIWLGLLALAAGSVAFALAPVPRPWIGGRHRRRDHLRRVPAEWIPGRHPEPRPTRQPHLVRLDLRPPPSRGPVRLGTADPRRDRRDRPVRRRHRGLRASRPRGDERRSPGPVCRAHSLASTGRRDGRPGRTSRRRWRGASGSACSAS